MIQSKYELARRKFLGAFYHNGTLAIIAIGDKPTPCHQVKIEESPLTVEPPRFTLTQCTHGAPCADVVTPYFVPALFPIGVYREKVLVTHADAVEEAVPVEEIKEYDPKRVLKLVSNGGGEVPFPSLLPTLAGKGIPLPYVIPPSAQGSKKPTTVTGYSESFDFREAFLNAVRALPPEDRPYPDQLTQISVVEIGAEFGGIAGLSRLLVRVKKQPDPLGG